MKKLLLVSLAIFLISGCTKTPEEKINDLYQSGIDQIGDLQLKSADSTFTQIFEHDPASVVGLLGFSKINDARLQYYDAINNYSMILANSTDYEDAFIGLYNAYKNLGSYHEALEAAVHYNKLWHTNTHTKYLLADAYKNIGDLKRAEGYLKQAIVSEYEHKNAAQLMDASILVLQGLHDEATKVASDAIANSSDDDVFYNAAAEYYETVGLIDSSMSYNKKFFNFDKSNINNAFVSFKRALKHNYLSDARQIISELESLNAEPIILEGLKLFYALHIDDKSLIRTHGQNYRAYAPNSLTGAIYEVHSRGEISDKLSIAQDLIALEAEIAKGKFTEEFGSYYHYKMLMLNIRYEKNPSSISQLENISGLFRNRKEFKLELALTKHIIGLFDQCYLDLKNIEHGHQKNPGWLTGLAESWGHYAVRKYDIAEETYKKALAVDPNYLPAFESYTKFLVRIKKPHKALELFNRYPQFEKNKFVSLSKTKFLFLNENYQDGLTQFKQYYAESSGDIVFVKELLDILQNESRQNEINAILDILHKEKMDVKLLLAKKSQDALDFNKSLTYLSDVITIEPLNAEANILKARGMYFAGQKTESYDLFEENLVKFNKNPRNLLYYSQILSIEGIDFDKASNMARQAAFEGYGTYEYIMSLADIYYRMGRYDLCRGESKKSYGINRENPYPYFRYGMACLKSQDKNRWFDEGKESLRKSKKLGLSGEFLKAANEALKN